VTIGIPTHNRIALLERALGGVLAQQGGDLEIIIADDASTDETPQRVASYTDPRIVYLRAEKNLGTARNTQRCLEHATGEFVIILNDDDELEPGAVARLLRPFQQPTQGIAPERVSVSWCVAAVQTPERQIKWLTGAGPELESGLNLVVGLFDGTRGPRFCGIMVRTEDARAVGGYSPRHGPIPDVGNWTQVALRREFAVCIPEPLVRYTAHNTSITGSSPAQLWQEAGEAIFDDLADYYIQNGDQEKLRRLRASRRNFICGLLVTVIMQSMGRPGWRMAAVKEFFRVPHYFFTPMMLRRLLVDGHKLLRRGSPAPTAVPAG
jgi:glycosyltransferase involved in cell wall biosynthesis